MDILDTRYRCESHPVPLCCPLAAHRDLVHKSGLTALLIFVFLHETYPDRILKIEVQRLRKTTGNTLLQAQGTSQATSVKVFSRAIVRPTKLLLCSPVMVGLSMYLALTYGEMYVLFTTYPEVFQEQYQFTPDGVGLSYLGLGVGLAVGAIFVGRYSDRLSRKLTAKHGCTKPEYIEDHSFILHYH